MKITYTLNRPCDEEMQKQLDAAAKGLKLMYRETAKLVAKGITPFWVRWYLLFCVYLLSRKAEIEIDDRGDKVFTAVELPNIARAVNAGAPDNFFKAVADTLIRAFELKKKIGDGPLNVTEYIHDEGKHTASHKTDPPPASNS